MGTQNKYGGWNHSGFSFVRASLTNAAAVFAITRDATNSALSSVFPNGAGPGAGPVWIDTVNFEFSSIAGLATTVSFYLCRDAAGNFPLTPVATQTILAGLGAATNGGASFNIQRAYRHENVAGVDVDDTIYMVAYLDADTAIADTRLYWRH